MAKKILLTGINDRLLIRKKGIFDWLQLYADVHRWLSEEKYEVQELEHKYKALNTFGEDHEVKLYAWRKDNDFIKWEYIILFVLWDLLPVTVEKDGKKKKLYQGRIKVSIQPYFVFDYNNRFSGKNSTRFQRKLLDMWISMTNFKWKVEGDKFESEFHRLQELIKKDLDLYAVGNQFDHNWR